MQGRTRVLIYNKRSVGFKDVVKIGEVVRTIPPPLVQLTARGRQESCDNFSLSTDTDPFQSEPVSYIDEVYI